MLKVMMLGHLVVEDEGGPRTASLGHKAQDLVVLVLTAPHRTLNRESAAEALWPGSPPETSRKAMRQVLWHVHKEVDARAAPAERLLLVEGDTLRANPDREVYVDADEFMDAARKAALLDADRVSASEATRLGRAAELYRGALHSGCYDDWCLVPRSRVEDRALTLMDLLSQVHERRGAVAEAIGWSQRLLEIEPAHERTHRRLMRVFARSGDRTRALRQLSECRRSLAASLGVEPDSRTEALGRAIAADQLAAVADTRDLAPDPAGRSGIAAADPTAPVVALPTPRPAGGRAAALTTADAAPLAAAGLDVLRGELTELRRSIEAIGDRLSQATG